MGYIDNRLKNDAKQENKKQGEKPSSEKDKNANVIADPEMENLIEIMKCSLTTDNTSIETLKVHLQTTRGFRIKLISDGRIDLLEMFPYFFVCPDLVRYELSFIPIIANKVIGSVSSDII